MKKYLVILLAVGLFGTAINAQIEFPRVSPNAAVSQTVGYTNITVTYCRPSVHERTIWGALVPYGQVWRTGANEATTIQFTTDVVVSGNKVPAGRYSLFTIPTKEEWTIILNKTDKQWGAYNYKQEDDILRFTVKPSEASFNEQLMFSFSNVSNSSAVLVLNWELLQVSFAIESDAAGQAYIKIKESIAAKPDRWQNYTDGASFAYDNNVFLDEALQWADKAISFGPNYVPYFVKGKILFKQNKFKDALIALDKCRETGRTDKNWNSFVSQVDLLEKQIKSKMN
ncbi:MAG: hypothetical protein CVV24_00630 [Ignavibacteriae bacterium HGW-Ignavibacteriae-3]|nr:MAG: hypothetical protein CVV24_00630 [Ignavibacteriae bacterium HGW-Ignavibacteriae-3]